MPMFYPILKLAVLGALLVGLVFLFLHLLPYIVGVLAVFGLYQLWQGMGGGRPPGSSPFGRR